MLEPRQTLFKLITDVVSKHNIPIDTIKPGIDKLVRGMSDADVRVININFRFFKC